MLDQTQPLCGATLHEHESYYYYDSYTSLYGQGTQFGGPSSGRGLREVDLKRASSEGTVGGAARGWVRDRPLTVLLYFLLLTFFEDVPHHPLYLFIYIERERERQKQIHI